MSSPREIYLEMWEPVKRAGKADFLEWLDRTDFYSAPCSTKHHLAEKEGLVVHSIHVAKGTQSFCKLYKNIVQIPEESQLIVSLTHDVCKANFYKESTRNVQGEDGKWNKVPFYVVEDKCPYGHGEKSAMLVSSFMKLTMEEQMAIRWHMGGFTSGIQDYQLSGALSKAFAEYPLAFILHMADMHATYMMERKPSI